MSKFLPLLVAPNLVTSLAPGQPWDFSPDNLEEIRAKTKKDRRKWACEPTTRWNCYTAVVGAVASQLVGKDNPAVALHGLVADYDMQQPLEYVLNLLNQLPPHLVPNFIEISLSKKVRLIWNFDRPLRVVDSKFASELIKGLFKKMGVPKLLPGYDDSSEKVNERWTNGGEWYEVNPEPMPWEHVLGMALDVSKKIEFAGSEIPIEQVAERIAELYPNRWEGEFKVGALGVRFWDDAADNETGCQVKPDGMLCFTGDKSFVYWREILGNDWFNERRNVNLAFAAADIHFDGRSYWREKAGVWRPVVREDVLLHLAAHGIPTEKRKGQPLSDAARVLHYIQENQHIDGAAPYINYRPGIIDIDNSRILNTSTLRALEPAADCGEVIPEKHFPWIWAFIKGLLESKDERALMSFLAWLQRFYRAIYEYKPAMGQAIFLCGPKSNGKTLLAMRIIKPLVGNKAANPYDHLVGNTNFNGDLFEAPLLAVNDEEAPEREAVKQKLLQRIKAFVVNPMHTFERKYMNRISVHWNGRIFITLNDDPNSIGILPEVNHNTHDKLMFFASRPFVGKWGNQQELEARIAAELPFFARWLMDIFEAPAEVLNDGRMGVESYFDERILELSKQQIHAYNLLELLAVWCRTGGFWHDPKETTWTGTPSDLMAQFATADQLLVLVRDWRVAGLAKSLATLARLESTGVQFVEGTQERSFRITRALVLKTPAILPL
jgi:hypothetical protein